MDLFRQEMELFRQEMELFRQEIELFLVLSAILSKSSLTEVYAFGLTIPKWF
jgi:hypothetical protein